MSDANGSVGRNADLSDLTIQELQERLREAEETLDAIRGGLVDVVVGTRDEATRLYTLENADRPYRELIEQMNEGALMLSIDGSVLYANGRLIDMLAKPLDAVIGQPFDRHIPAGKVSEFREFLAAGHRQALRQELVLATGAGSTIPISMSVSPLHVTAAGEQLIVCAVVLDLTEQRRAEAQLRQSQKMEAVGQLTGGLAHDFNNLLQAIHGNLELIQRLPANVEKVKQWAHNAARSVERGAKLTAQLLAFSRTQQVALSSLIVDDLIRGLEEMLTRSLGAAVTVTFELNAEDVAVTADPTQLELALLNLAINARDAMPEGGALMISSRTVVMANAADLRDGNYVEIRVADTGLGMPDEVRAKAFEPFFTTKGVGAGTGLGLAQVFGIARQAGGTARIESESGRGTTVSILLRPSGSPVASLPSAPDKALAYTIRSRHILVVDDDRDIRTFLVESLELLGYTVDSAADASDALQFLERCRTPPDAILLDYAMPHTTGGELASIVRRRLPALPIAFITGFADNLKLSAIPGAQPVVLLKPFPIEVLAATVARMLM